MLSKCHIIYPSKNPVRQIHTPHFRASQVALVLKNLSANAGDIRDAGSILGSGRSPGSPQPT